jgi:hypothetical protein
MFPSGLEFENESLPLRKGPPASVTARQMIPKLGQTRLPQFVIEVPKHPAPVLVAPGSKRAKNSHSPPPTKHARGRLIPNFPTFFWSHNFWRHREENVFRRFLFNSEHLRNLGILTARA